MRFRLIYFQRLELLQLASRLSAVKLLAAMDPQVADPISLAAPGELLAPLWRSQVTCQLSSCPQRTMMPGRFWLLTTFGVRPAILPGSFASFID